MVLQAPVSASKLVNVAWDAREEGIGRAGLEGVGAGIREPFAAGNGGSPLPECCCPTDAIARTL